MILIEQESDRYIPPHKYYILILTISDTKSLNLREIAKKMLVKNISHQPLSAYVFENDIFLVYSCVDNEQNHYNGGSHHKIISEYVSGLTLQLKTKIEGKILEFDSKTSVITYFIWKIHSNSLKFMVDVSNDKISSGDTKTKTLGELTLSLQDLGIDWDNLDPVDKYGVSYKLKKKKGKIIVCQLSEFFDSRDMKKYLNFIFG